MTPWTIMITLSSGVAVAIAVDPVTNAVQVAAWPIEQLVTGLESGSVR